MSHNSFGHLLRVTTWGESHGPALGCVVDGCPPGIPLEAAEIQHWLDLRKPGTSRFVTQRREPDEVRILSGVFGDDRTGDQKGLFRVCAQSQRAGSIFRAPICTRAARILTPSPSTLRATAPAATRAAVSRAEERPPPR